jgi:hypothetical protein
MTGGDFMRKTLLAALALILTGLVPGTFVAQQKQGDSPVKYGDPREGETTDRSDRFTFARVRFGPPTMPGDWLGDHGLMWSHDYPDAGLHLMKILSEVSKTRVTVDTNEHIFSFDDPNLCKYPLAYLCEVGYMHLTDQEAHGMREYLLRGGFLIVDDFRQAWQWRNFTDNVKRALPEYEIKELDVTHPIFNCFFSIKTLDVRTPYDRGKPIFYGLADKKGRLMMIINFNNDVSDWWQWSNDPFQPIQDTNDSYRFGVNYIMYAMTH